METRNNYIIQGGEEGKSRLNVLSDVLKSTTRSLLESVGKLSGKRLLDIGSGGGHVSLMMSELVGPKGFVTAIDFDQEIIRLSVADAKALGIENVAYCAMDAYALEYENEFDVAYSRFLLSHLQQPQVVLNKMARSVRSGGSVVVEDIDFSGHFCYPTSDAFTAYVNYYSTVSRNNGQNPDLGLYLQSLFNAESLLEDIRLEVIQPCFNEGRGKWMAYFTMDKIKETVIKQGLADAVTIDAVLSELKKFTEDNQSIISLPRIFRVSGVKVS
ncbi:MAG: methyltransferase domain-containing protein [Bacteroidota bacterium]